MTQYQPIFVGILAGIAAGLMVFAAFNAGLLAFLLFFAAPAAIYLAAMGWGNLGGIVATLTGTVLIGTVGGTSIAALAGILLFIPATYVGYLVNLGHKNDDQGNILWFPLSDILLRLMIILAGGFILIGVISGYNSEVFSQAFIEMMHQLAESNPDLPRLSDAQLVERADLYSNLLPIIAPCIWLLPHVITAFIAASITRSSGLLARQDETVANVINLPLEAAGFLGVGLLGYFLFDDAIAQASSVLLGIGIGGYGLVGLAQLHIFARSFPTGKLLLSASYTAIILFSVPFLFFTIMGLIRSFSTHNSGSNDPDQSTKY